MAVPGHSDRSVADFKQDRILGPCGGGRSRGIVAGMVDLRWDIDWVDEQFDHGLLGYDGYYPMNVGYPLTEKHVELFSSVMPASVMHIWKRFGFDGFGEGRFWFTDPLRWQAQPYCYYFG